MALIELNHVDLTFWPRVAYRVTLKELVLARVTGMPRRPRTSIQALKDVTLQVKEGDRLGIIGANGAGKSSLLRLLAGIYAPTSGQVCVEGSIGSLFEINVGFEPEATGWENIYFRG